MRFAIAVCLLLCGAAVGQTAILVAAELLILIKPGNVPSVPSFHASPRALGPQEEKVADGSVRATRACGTWRCQRCAQKVDSSSLRSSE